MNKYYKITILGLGHLLVDLQGIYLINIISNTNHHPLIYVAIYFLIYNFIAFALQPLFGYLSDKFNLQFLYIILGLLLPTIALQFYGAGLIMIIIATLGNAMYHVGGGVISVNLFPRKAAPTGIFVAPGALGVYAGLLLAGESQDYLLYVMILALLVILLLFTAFNKKLPKNIPYTLNRNFIKIIIYIMGIVFIRGFLGLNLILSWKSNYILAAVLVFSVFLGKFLGGILADKFGLLEIGVGGLLASMPFLILSNSFPVLGIIGAFLFNFTMAITLFIIIDSLGQYKGFAFGLTTLALFISYLPGVLGFSFMFNWVYFVIAIPVSICLASYLLFRVFSLYKEGGDLNVD